MKKRTIITCPFCKGVIAAETSIFRLGGDDWLECIPLTREVAAIPSGCIIHATGNTVWIDGNGERFTREDYKTKYGVDPELVWAAARPNRKIIYLGGR